MRTEKKREKEMIGQILKERIGEIIAVAKETKCYEYLDMLIECETMKDLAELVLFLKIVGEGNEEIEKFAKVVRKFYVDTLKQYFKTV